MPRSLSHPQRRPRAPMARPDDVIEKEDEPAPVAARQVLSGATSVAVMAAHPSAAVKGFGLLVDVAMKCGAQLSLLERFIIATFEQSPAAAAAGGGGTCRFVCCIPKEVADTISALFEPDNTPPARPAVMREFIAIKAYEAVPAPADTPDSAIVIMPGAEPITLSHLLFQKPPGSVSMDRELRKCDVLRNLEALRIINTPISIINALAECSVTIARDAAAPAGAVLHFVRALADQDPPVPWARAARIAAESDTSPIDVGALEHHVRAKEVAAAARRLLRTGAAAAAASAAAGGGVGGGGGGGGGEAGEDGGEEVLRAAAPAAAGKPRVKRPRKGASGCSGGGSGSGGELKGSDGAGATVADLEQLLEELTTQLAEERCKVEAERRKAEGERQARLAAEKRAAAAEEENTKLRAAAVRHMVQPPPLPAPPQQQPPQRPALPSAPQQQPPQRPAPSQQQQQQQQQQPPQRPAPSQQQQEQQPQRPALPSAPHQQPPPQRPAPSQQPAPSQKPQQQQQQQQQQTRKRHLSVPPLVRQPDSLGYMSGAGGLLSFAGTSRPFKPPTMAAPPQKKKNHIALWGFVPGGQPEARL
ncbi:MAG: hypothetical protein J3K34DRAFT_518939 [Monoraphidium minutum]|nr:MAG: hypothetical protein J3K34DRAFT_518939 [Monoraphidium minutum]